MPPEPPPSPGQAKVFREECLSHVDALYGAALRMTANKQDAEDLVQETYLKAIRGLHRYRDDGSCKAWLFRILTNAYIDRYRQSRRAPTRVDFDDEGASGQYGRAAGEGTGLPAGDAPQTDADVRDFLTSFVADEVKIAVDHLPDVFRETIVLRDIQGFSYQEIAGLLEKPVGTVMSRLYRGRRLLREALRDYGVANGYVRAREAS